MTYAPSKRVAYAEDADGHHYTLHFFGEDEGAAVIIKSPPSNTGRFEEAPEVYRVPAATPEEALAKLKAALPGLGLRLGGLA